MRYTDEEKVEIIKMALYRYPRAVADNANMKLRRLWNYINVRKSVPVIFNPNKTNKLKELAWNKGEQLERILGKTRNRINI